MSWPRGAALSEWDRHHVEHLMLGPRDIRPDTVGGHGRPIRHDAGASAHAPIWFVDPVYGGDTFNAVSGGKQQAIYTPGAIYGPPELAPDMGETHLDRFTWGGMRIREDLPGD